MSRDIERLEAQLNQLGKEGWELVSIILAGSSPIGNVTAILKREKEAT